MVQKFFDLAMELRCPFFMENPHSGLLKSRAVVMGIPFRIVDYCKYADDRFPHRARKRTAIWTNTDWHPQRPLCNHDCGYCDGKRHRGHAQQEFSKGQGTAGTTFMRYPRSWWRIFFSTRPRFFNSYREGRSSSFFVDDRCHKEYCERDLIFGKKKVS